jgi:hypothetical protein
MDVVAVNLVLALNNETIVASKKILKSTDKHGASSFQEILEVLFLGDNIMLIERVETC